MKLLRVHVIKAKTCGGLLDGLDIGLRDPAAGFSAFTPLCLVGANGTGKSQLLQVIAEAFQSVFHACVPHEERVEGNPDLEFELEYLIRPTPSSPPAHVRASRVTEGRRRGTVKLERRDGMDWVNYALTSEDAEQLLPRKVVGYTSGDNETLSLPFLISRSGYADEVRTRALNTDTTGQSVPDTRLMLIDYATHLEVLVANLVLGSSAEREAILADARLCELHSFRCVVQLAHSAIKKASAKLASRTGRKGVQLTTELERYLDWFRRCATCCTYDEKTETYVFDYYLDAEARNAFRHFWGSSVNPYGAFHKLSMLNDLGIPKKARERFRRDTRNRRFASRLPEPQDEDKVFRFDQLQFSAPSAEGVVDYVSLSDGEHQLVQALGTMCMLSFPKVLFLLDEPESHLNPEWRVRFLSRLLDLPCQDGSRAEAASSGEQECLLTTHSPFVPSDMPRERVLVFRKDGRSIQWSRPQIETFGSTFDTRAKSQLPCQQGLVVPAIVASAGWSSRRPSASLPCRSSGRSGNSLPGSSSSSPIQCSAPRGPAPWRAPC